MTEYIMCSLLLQTLTLGSLCVFRHTKACRISTHSLLVSAWRGTKNVEFIVLIPVNAFAGGIAPDLLVLLVGGVGHSVALLHFASRLVGFAGRCVPRSAVVSVRSAPHVLLGLLGILLLLLSLGLHRSGAGGPLVVMTLSFGIGGRSRVGQSLERQLVVVVVVRFIEIVRSVERLCWSCLLDCGAGNVGGRVGWSCVRDDGVVRGWQSGCRHREDEEDAGRCELHVSEDIR